MGEKRRHPEGGSKLPGRINSVENVRDDFGSSLGFIPIRVVVINRVHDPISAIASTNDD